MRWGRAGAVLERVAATHLQGRRPWRALQRGCRCKCVAARPRWGSSRAGGGYAFAGAEALQHAPAGVQVQMRSGEAALEPRRGGVAATHLQGRRPCSALQRGCRCKCVAARPRRAAPERGGGYAFAGAEALEGTPAGVQVQMRSGEAAPERRRGRAEGRRSGVAATHLQRRRPCSALQRGCRCKCVAARLRRGAPERGGGHAFAGAEALQRPPAGMRVQMRSGEAALGQF